MRDSRVNIMVDCVDAVRMGLLRSRYKDFGDQIRSLSEISQDKRRVKLSDFNLSCKLSSGGFGDILFSTRNGKPYVIKRIRKDKVAEQPSIAPFMAERNAMIDSNGSEWLVSAHCTFQDEVYIYFVMDFFPGGDFLEYLVKQKEITEDVIRFYGAEMVEALEELHGLGYIHRDLKPENLFICKDGHLRLGDFGSCIKTVDGKAKSSSTVGTPDYISPEILCSVGTTVEYGYEVDMWTLGVVLYDMLYEVQPFYATELAVTYDKISKIDFSFPDDKGSDEFKDLICRLITSRDKRLTINQVKSHPFFSGTKWGTLKSEVPPFIPVLSGDFDLSNFRDVEKDVGGSSDCEKYFLNFVGFTFDPEYCKIVSKELVSSQNDKSQYEEIGHVLKNSAIVDVLGKTASISTELERTIAETLKDVEELKNRSAEIIRLYEKEKIASREEMGKRDGLVNEAVTINTLDEEITTGGKSFELESSKINSMSECDEENTDKSRAEFQSKIPSLQRRECIMEQESLERELKRQESVIKHITLKNKRMKLRLKEERESVKRLKSICKERKIGEYQMETYKRKLKICKAEVKEFEQKLQNELNNRNRLEDEILVLKNEIMALKKAGTVSIQRGIAFNVKDQITKKKETLEIDEKGTFKYIDIEINISNVYARLLKDNELFHIPSRERGLTLCITIVSSTESFSSSTSNQKVNLKKLEDDIRIEENIVEGIKKILNLSTGSNYEAANQQLQGSLKRLEELKRDLVSSKRSSDCVYEEYDRSVQFYEFNRHTFKSKSLPRNSLCEHCNKIILGAESHGLQCVECNMVVHKNCYVLVDVSCELFKAFATGRKVYATMRNAEDLDRILEIIGNKQQSYRII